ncbi:hypothetical protein C8R46DRAFT_1059255 [Mycena filopes]|nr:hypothetical protein C8R46DRAFT_1059255 [Mycena filopes]
MPMPTRTTKGGPTLPKLSVLLPLQLILFPAYCALVGAAILFYPTCLATIAFPASVHLNSRSLIARIPYIILAHCLPFASPPTPIRVFAHWATVAHLHVAIFLALLVGIAYLVPAAGVLLSGLCGALFVRAWGDFSLAENDDDEVNGVAKMELGAEVRGMLYQILVAPECGFADGDRMEKVGQKYVLFRGPPKEETRAEILAAGGLDESDSGEDADADDE